MSQVFSVVASVHHKINIGLHIIEKLSSGYHALETFFYPCHNFEDTIEITPSSQFSFSLTNADFDCETEENMCVKAYRLMQKIIDLPPVSIKLTKRIPSGAGLGGGSADAAFTFKLLNNLFSLKLKTRQLHEFAAQVGSDAPFFLYDTPMFATGRGDILTPVVLDLSKYRIEIVTPHISVSTPQAYSAITPKKPKHALEKLIQFPIETWKDLIINDFEEIIFYQYPKLSEIKNEFYRKGAVYAAMSGSGSAVFGIFNKD